MLTGVQFGPRLDCFDECKGSADNSISLQPRSAHRKSHDRKGRYTVFDDDPVAISPSHPLAQEKRFQTELSEVWTRRNEDLDWDSMINTDSSNKRTRQMLEKRRSLEELTSLKFTNEWNVGVDSSKTSTSDGSKVTANESRRRASISNTIPISQMGTDTTNFASFSDGSGPSTTGLEDSRMSFPLHDLTGPVQTKEREIELMRYMGVNNLDFERAKRYAPKDVGEPAHGVFRNAVFRGISRDSTSTDTVVQERMVPDPQKAKMKEISTCTNVIDKRQKQLEPLSFQANDISLLIKYLSQSKANLMCITMDGYATLASAERMVQRANDWFHQMLDDLEKRIKDERRIRRNYRRSIKRLLRPVIRKLCDLELIYETLNYLDKQTSAAEKTITLSRENMRNGRKILAKLTALDSKRTQLAVDTGATTLAAEAATAFFLLEQDFLDMAPFIARSSQAAALMDVVITQMRGIHKAVVEQVPRRSLSEYNALVASQSTETAKAPTILSIPPLDGEPKNLFAAPRRRKFRSYMKLDPWPSEVGSHISSTDAISSSAILSAKISTLPLSDYHESARSNTPTESCASCQEKIDMFANFNPNQAKNLGDDRPPTAVGSRGCTPSETSICTSFEEAKLIPNPKRNKGSASKSSASVSSAIALSAAASAPKSVTKSDEKHSKTPDPIRSWVRKGANTGTPRSKKGEHGRKAKKIVIKEELLAQSPVVRSPLKTSRTQISEHVLIPHH